MRPASGPRRLLLVRLSHLGDVVHALPVYHALRAAEPAAELGWVVQDEFAPLVEPLPGLARVFRFGRRRGLGAWLALERELAAWAPDLAVDAQGNVKSAMALLVSRAPRRVGPAWQDWRERFAAHVATEHCAPASGPHAMDRMAALARHLAPGAPLRWDPCVTEPERDRARARWRELGAPLPWILAVPRPGDPRSLGRGQLAGLARELGRVLVLSGPAEATLGEELRADLAGSPEVRHWVGQRGLRELAALFTVAAGDGARLVACDSGPMHLAAACGLPVDLVAGPQEPRRTGPWPASGGPHRALRPDPTLPCAPCLRPRCNHPRGPVCMSERDPVRLAAELLGR